MAYSTNAYILFYERVNAKKESFISCENVLSLEVQAENLKLIREVQVHQECFFNAIYKLYLKYKPDKIN